MCDIPKKPRQPFRRGWALGGDPAEAYLAEGRRLGGSGRAARGDSGGRRRTSRLAPIFSRLRKKNSRLRQNNSRLDPPREFSCNPLIQNLESRSTTRRHEKIHGIFPANRELPPETARQVRLGSRPVLA
jgi:hypothetical protein